MLLTNISTATFREDKKHDTQLLSEISLNDNRLFIALYENIRRPSPHEAVTSDQTIILGETDMSNVQLLGDIQMPKYADLDQPLELDKYFIYDSLSGSFDDPSSFITTSTKEQLSNIQSVRQYITQIQGYIEIEIILVDMSLKR